MLPEMTGVGASLIRSSPSPSITSTLTITNHDFGLTTGGEVVYYYPGETFTSPEDPLICPLNQQECVVTPSYIQEQDTYSEFNILVMDLTDGTHMSLDFLFAGEWIMIVVIFFFYSKLQKMRKEDKKFVQCSF